MNKKNKEKIDIPLIRNYNDGIYYLYNSYNKIFNILDAVIFSDHIIPNKALNIFYGSLLEGVNNIISQKEYKSFKKIFPDHPDNILNLFDEIRVWWEEDLRNKSLNFIAQTQKEYIKIGDYKSSNTSFNKVMSGIDIAINNHINIDQDLTKKDNEKLEKLKNKNKLIQYKYKRNFGILTVKNIDPIEFKGAVSAILNFFYYYSDLDNSFKNFRDFMKYDDRLITSSEFKKKIDKINKRINEKTKGKIKSIIMTAEKEKPTQTNKYKWQVVI